MTFTNQYGEFNAKFYLTIGGIVFAVLAFIALMPFVIVGAAENVVITQFGQIDRTLGPGIHWVTPIVERSNKYSSRIQKIEVAASAASGDLQDVSTTVAINYAVNGNSVAELYVATKFSHEETVLQPVIQESIKSVTARYTAEELITKRALVKEEILELVKAGVTSRFGGKELIIVNDLAITNFEFSASFNSAIEAKVKAEQEALKAQNDLERVKFEAEQRIAQAQAEAEAIKIQAQAINSQGGADYVNLKAIEKWNGVLPTQMIPGGTVPFINLNTK